MIDVHNLQNNLLCSVIVNKKTGIAKQEKSKLNWRSNSIQCVLMWTFIACNLYELTDSKVQLNINKVINRRLNNKARSYKRRRSVTGRLWWIGFGKLVSFEFFYEGGNRYCSAYIVRKVIPDLSNIKGKTIAKVSDL